MLSGRAGNFAMLQLVDTHSVYDRGHTNKKGSGNEEYNSPI